MRAKEYLSQLMLLRKECDAVEKCLNEINDQRKDLEGLVYADSDTRRDVKKLMEKHANLYCDYIELKEKYFSLFQFILEQIRMIKPCIYADVLYMRYVEGKSYHTIAKEIHYADKYIMNVHGIALRMFEKRWKDVLDDGTAPILKDEDPDPSRRSSDCEFPDPFIEDPT